MNGKKKRERKENVYKFILNFSFIRLKKED